MKRDWSEVFMALVEKAAYVFLAAMAGLMVGLVFATPFMAAGFNRAATGVITAFSALGVATYFVWRREERVLRERAGRVVEEQLFRMEQQTAQFKQSHRRPLEKTPPEGMGSNDGG